MFQIGDLITGIDTVQYTWTTSESVCKVIEHVDIKEGIYHYDIRVRVVEHTNDQVIGKVWPVCSKYFVLVKSGVRSSCNPTVSAMFD